MSKPSSALIEHIYRMAGGFRDDISSDATLLSRYAEMHDEKAFSALMVRHGVMVWSICRRILGNTQDTEEAYQTTFLALASKANKIRSNEPLVGWLHQVAYQTAVSARRKVRAQTKLKERLRALSPSEAESGFSQTDIYEELHGEIAQLPEKLRVALVLHYLEGKTQTEMAHILGVTESGIRDRLNRGKVILQKRLVHRGMAVGATALGILLAEAVSHAGMQSGLISKTLKAATSFQAGTLRGGIAELAREVLKQSSTTMPWWKTGWVVAILCVSGVGVGLSGVAWQSGIFTIGAGRKPTANKKETPIQSEKEPVRSPRLDIYGDPLPKGALARLGTSRLRHAVGGDCRVASLQFTADGKGLLTAGPHNPPRLWSTVDGKLLRQFGNLPPEHVIGVVLSPDGRFLACREGNRQVDGQNLRKGNLHIWETATGKFVRKFEGDASDQLAVNCAFSSDGKLVAARLHNIVGVWEVATGRELWVQSPDDVRAIAFSADDKAIASANERSSLVVVQDAHTGREIRTFNYRGAMNPTLAFSPKENAALLSSGMGTLSLWDVNSGKARWSTPQPGFATLSPDGKLIAAYQSGLPHIQILDSATGKQLRRWSGDDPSTPLAISPDGKLLASTDGPVVHFRDMASGKKLPHLQLRAHDWTVSSACFLPDDETLVSGGADGTVRIWDSGSGLERQVFSTQHCSNLMDYTDTFQPAFSSALSPDGETLAASFFKSKKDIHELSDFPTVINSAFTDLRLWNVRTGRELPGFQTSKGTWLLKKMIYSPNNKFLAATLKISQPLNEEVIVWDLSTGKQCGLNFPGYQPAFSLEGDVLFAYQNEADGAGKCSWIKFCNIATGKTVHEIKLPKITTSMAVSPDRRMIATTNTSPTGNGIILVNLRWGEGSSRVRHGAAREIEFSPTLRLQTCAFSADGRLLAAGGEDKLVHVWEVASGKERGRFAGHIGAVAVLCFSKDGKRLVSGGEDGNLLVWDLTDRMQENGTLLPLRCSERQLEKLWKELGDSDAVRAGLILWKLTAAEQAAVTLLKKHLQPIKPLASAKVVDQLLSDLDSEVYQVRKQALDALANIGEQCEPALRQALTRKPSVEKRRVIQTLLAAWENSTHPPEVRRQMRGVEVLERIGSPTAQGLLHELAAGAPGARLTTEARDAVTRLEQAQRRPKDSTISAKKLQP